MTAFSASAAISGLFIYPVKSLRGIAVAEAAVDALGLAGDRRFMVVDGEGRFLTQRSIPRMATISTALGGGKLVLSAAGAAPISVPREAGAGSVPKLRAVTVWRDSGLEAEDCGEEPAGWLSAILGISCRLVRAGGRFQRPVNPAKAAPGDRVSFADGYPFLAVGEATLAALNARLAAAGASPVPMDRFRPNLVIAGARPHEEDEWGRFQAGGIRFRAAGPCGRCVITTTDQLTGKRGAEPLRTLALYRQDARREVIFGQNLIHETKSGILRVGDPIRVP